MAICEHCMSSKDLKSFSDRDMYIAVLGFKSDLGTVVNEVSILPKSKLDLYKKGFFFWQVIKHKKVPPVASKQEKFNLFYSLCGNYLIEKSEPQKISHEERLQTAYQIANVLTQRPYVSEVGLTGSTALGKDREDSDLDLLVVLNKCPRYEAHIEMDELVSRYPGNVELYCISQHVFSQAKQHQFPLVNNAIPLAHNPLSH
jgi:predicted nucleotidyltransferase